MQNHLALNTYVHGYFGYDQISRTLWRGPHILWTFWTGPNVLQSIWLADIRLFWTGPNNRQDIREIGSLASVPQRRVRGCLAEPHPFPPLDAATRNCFLVREHCVLDRDALGRTFTLRYWSSPLGIQLEGPHPVPSRQNEQ